MLIVMSHAARQLPAWLIFDVGQKMMKSSKWLVAAVLFVSMGIASEVRLVPIGVALTNTKIPELATIIEDGYVVSFVVFNDSKEVVTLPSKFLGPEFIERDDSVIVLFTFFPQTFTSKSGRRPIIPSREAFAPVELRPGECMVLEPARYTIERKATKLKPLFFALKTAGFLADRMGFTAVDVKATLLLPDMSASPDRRIP